MIIEQTVYQGFDSKFEYEFSSRNILVLQCKTSQASKVVCARSFHKSLNGYFIIVIGCVSQQGPFYLFLLRVITFARTLDTATALTQLTYSTHREINLCRRSFCMMT